MFMYVYKLHNISVLFLLQSSMAAPVSPDVSIKEPLILVQCMRVSLFNQYVTAFFKNHLSVCHTPLRFISSKSLVKIKF